MESPLTCLQDGTSRSYLLEIGVSFKAGREEADMLSLAQSLAHSIAFDK